MGRTTSRTGIGVRGTTAQLGGISTQPIPFVLPSALPVTRTTSPVTPVVAPAAVAEALIAGLQPNLEIPISNVINGTIDNAIRDILPINLTNMQYQPTAQPSPLVILGANLNSSQRPNDEMLSLSQLTIRNNQFELADSHGINKLRPEIIALMDYEPIFFKDENVLNDVGLLMDFQYQARNLRNETLIQAIKGIEEIDDSQELRNIENDFTVGLRKINTAANFYQNTIGALENAKTGFDIKNIPASSFNTPTFRTLSDFFESFMMFPRDAVNGFSGTKILMQLLFDTKAIAESYSMNLLNLTDPDRESGGIAARSPTNIDRTYNNRNGFSFTYETIRSYRQPENAAQNAFFTRFNASLPQSPDDRIKILVNMISKELRVSKGLGKTKVIADLRQKFNATTTDGSPFDNIIGGIGNSIFESVTGTSSLAALAVLNNDAGTFILPFENKYIETNGNKKVYIPGSSFFIDSITNVTNLNSFNLTPFRTYVEKFSQTTDDASSLICSLFEYGQTVSSLAPIEIFKIFLQTISHGLNYLVENSQRSGLQLNSADAAAIAVMRLATTDLILKRMLFQFLILSLIGSDSTFFKTNLIEELANNVENLDLISVDDSARFTDLRTPNSTRSFLTTLGGSIQSRVVQLVNQQNSGRGFNAQNRDRNGVLPEGLMRIGFDVDVTFGIPAALVQSRFVTGLVQIFIGIESVLGNETNNILDALKRTRFNSLSVSTLVLMMFEVYSNIASRYVKVDFETSAYGQNFPDMIVDTTFNAHMQISLEDVIAEATLPLEVISSDVSANGTKNSGHRQTQRAVHNSSQTAVQHAYGQVNEAAEEAGVSSSDLHDGLSQNESILGGPTATAGSRHTSASQLARRRVNRNVISQNLIDAYALDRSIDSIASKLIQEDLAIAASLHILLVVKQRLQTTLDVAVNYFNDQTLNGFSSLNATSLNDISKNLSPTQVRLLLKERDFIVDSLSTGSRSKTQLVQQDLIKSSTRTLITSLLNQSMYRESMEAGLRYRLLTIGVPSGFSKNLIQRLQGDQLNINDFQKTKNYDLITIKVYKRSLEFPQLIFKPQKFLFDLSLFNTKYQEQNQTTIPNFENVLTSISLVDYQNFSQPRELTLNELLDSDSYSSNLDFQSRSKLFENHVVSNILNDYIQALTTMNFNESTFIDTQSETWRRLGQSSGDLTPRFAELVRKYVIAKRLKDIRRNSSLQPLPDLSIEEMLRSRLVDQSTKDLLKLLTYGNVVFKTEKALASLLTPKIFERIFTIPLNIDDFEIDYEATVAAQSGRELFEKDFFQNKLDSRQSSGIYKLKPRSHKDVVFEDYFVTIELME